MQVIIEKIKYVIENIDKSKELKYNSQIKDLGVLYRELINDITLKAIENKNKKQVYNALKDILSQSKFNKEIYNNIENYIDNNQKEDKIELLNKKNREIKNTNKRVQRKKKSRYLKKQLKR